MVFSIIIRVGVAFFSVCLSDCGTDDAYAIGMAVSSMIIGVNWALLLDVSVQLLFYLHNYASSTSPPSPFSFLLGTFDILWCMYICEMRVLDFRILLCIRFFLPDLLLLLLSYIRPAVNDIAPINTCVLRPHSSAQS